MNTRKSLLSRSITTAAFAAAIFGAGMMAPKPALAVLPFTDYANLYQAVVSDMKRAFEWAEQKAMMMTQMDLEGIFAEMNVDTINNGFSNMIARIGRANQEVQNIEQLERAQPAQDACATVSLGQNLMEGVCSAIDSITNAAAGRADFNMVASGGGKPVVGKNGEVTIVPGQPATVDEINKANQTIANTLFEQCEGTKGKCQNTSLLIAPPGSVLSDEEYKEAQLMNKVAGGALLPQPKSDPTADLNSASYKKQRLYDIEMANRNEMLRVSRDNLLVINQGTLKNGNQREMGEVTQLEQYLSERMGSENWLCEVTNSCKDGKTYVPPAELEKRKIQMQAVLLHISMQQYKSSLRTERLLTDLTDIELKQRRGSGN